MSVTLIGFKELQDDLTEIARRIEDTEPVTEALAAGMRTYVHVQTGYLKSTIYHTHNVAGASAPYAAAEAYRGGSHDYAAQAIDEFDLREHANHIVEPF